MAREYAKVSPRFWVGDTGRQIRELGRDAQVVAMYLLSCPSSNMIGLYYLPLPTLSHETGIPLQGASKALRRLSEAHFAHYDETEEVVWVPEMARHQIEGSLKPGDKRVIGVSKEAAQYKKSRYYKAFLQKYAAAFNLRDTPPAEPLASPFEGASEALRSQEQEQEQEQERDCARQTGRSKLEIPPEALETAEYLLAAIRSHTPDFEPALDGERLSAWAQELDRAVRLDARTWEGLRKAIDFAHRHTETFWRANVLSATKLRKQYETLRQQAQRARTNGHGAAASSDGSHLASVVGEMAARGRR
jgi:hypothetical protein